MKISVRQIDPDLLLLHHGGCEQDAEQRGGGGLPPFSVFLQSPQILLAGGNGFAIFPLQDVVLEHQAGNVNGRKRRIRKYPSGKGGALLQLGQVQPQRGAHKQPQKRRAEQLPGVPPFLYPDHGPLQILLPQRIFPAAFHALQKGAQVVGIPFQVLLEQRHIALPFGPALFLIHTHVAVVMQDHLVQRTQAGAPAVFQGLVNLAHVPEPLRQAGQPDAQHIVIKAFQILCGIIAHGDGGQPIVLLELTVRQKLDQRGNIPI